MMIHVKQLCNIFCHEIKRVEKGFFVLGAKRTILTICHGFSKRKKKKTRKILILIVFHCFL
jgi:hypothetical protein